MMMPYGLSRRSNFSCSIHACMILRSDGSARSTCKAASNITAFLYCSWHRLRLSFWKSYGRCRPTGGPHGPDGSCKHSKGVSSSVLQDKMFKAVEKVRGYNNHGLLHSWRGGTLSTSVEELYGHDYKTSKNYR